MKILDNFAINIANRVVAKNDEVMFLTQEVDKLKLSNDEKASELYHGQKLTVELNATIRKLRENNSELSRENENLYRLNEDRAEEIDDENKVVVPDFVAEWIEYNLSERVDLSIMLGCYKVFLENNEPAKTEGEKAVNWFVKYPYKFIRAYVEGYQIEESNEKYYWRKKKEHLAWFEDEECFYFNYRIDKKIMLADKNSQHLYNGYKTEFTEAEAKELMKDDFDMFEKVEVE